jgi:hypothetical protein
MSHWVARKRYPWIGVALLLFLNAGRVVAAGCHTDCVITWGPDCQNCGFRALSNVTCYRGSCDSCDTFYCGVSLPSRADQWASGVTSPDACSAPASQAAPVSTVRIVKIQRLAARG